MRTEDRLERTRLVYTRLQDDYSRWLYEKRAMWSLTRNSLYAEDITDSIIDADKFKALMKRAGEVHERLVIRGAGNDYNVIKRLCPELDFCVFVDNDLTKIHKRKDGREIVSPEEFYENYPEYHVLVNSMAANSEIVDELKDHGIPDSHIINLKDCYEDACDKQYFDKEIMKPSRNEVFIDGGCYDGRTVFQFAKWCGGKYDEVYSFEPDNANYELAKGKIARRGISNVTLINKGLWDKEEELRFSGDGTQASRISDTAGTVIRATAVDNVLNGRRATFIKLDVEGAEYNALLGAGNTIRKYRPKLAISIYHKPEDIFELPELILSMNPDYKFWLRHYQLSINESILYAV